MKKMLFTIVTIGTMVPAAASAQAVPLGTPVDTARMSTRGVSPETRERVLELRERAVQERARSVETRARAMVRMSEPRARAMVRMSEPRAGVLERSVRAQGNAVRALEQRRMLVARQLEGSRARQLEDVRRAAPLRTPMMMELSEEQRGKMRKLQEDHAEKRRDLEEKRRDLDGKRRDLDQDLQKKLRDILTEEQRARMEQRRIDR